MQAGILKKLSLVLLIALCCISIFNLAEATTCNIVGTWTKNTDWNCNGNITIRNITFESNGTFRTSTGQGGTWTLSENQVRITYSNDVLYIGTIDTSCNNMSGTITSPAGNNGCWTATRSATTQNTLSVSKSGTGSGTVTSSPSGINCGSTCSASYNSGTSVILTAVASIGSNFEGWSGDCIGTSTTCTVTMNSSKNVTATFTSNQCTVTSTVTNFGSAGGTGLITLSGACSGQWQATTNVDWITFRAICSTGGVCSNSTYSGTGGGSIGFKVEGNYTGNARTGQINVMGNTITISQNTTMSCTTCNLNFNDMPIDFSTQSIQGIGCAGITTGCGNNNYCPNSDVTREQMAAFIVRAKEGEPPYDYCANGSLFVDVTNTSIFCKYISRLYEMNVTTGCGGNNYCPSSFVTREQMAAFIVRSVYGEPPSDYCSSGSPFNDVSASSTFCKYIKKLKELGITTGCGNNNYCPSQNVPRSQMAVFLYRAFLKGGCDGSVQVIGSGGGTVTNNGATVTVPPGALTENTAVVITKMREPANTDEITPAYEIVGLPYNHSKEITIQIPISSLNSNNGSILATEPIYTVIAEDMTTITGNVTRSAKQFYRAEVSGNNLIYKLPASSAQSNVSTPQQGGYTTRRVFTIWFVQGYDAIESDHFRIVFPARQCSALLMRQWLQYAEESYNLLMERGIGFDPSVLIGLFGKKTTIYVEDIGQGVYGQAGYFGPISAAFSGRHALAFQMNTLYCNDWNQNTLQEMRITIGHEFFHLVQYSYDPTFAGHKASGISPYNWLYEASSTWFESIVRGEPNTLSDVAQENHKFYNKGLERGACGNCGGEGPVALRSQRHGYGAAAFIHHLVSEYGNSILLTIWNQIRYGNPRPEYSINAIQNAGVGIGDWWYVFVVRYLIGEINLTNYNIPPQDATFEYSETTNSKQFNWITYPLSAHRTRLDFTNLRNTSRFSLRFDLIGGPVVGPEIGAVLYNRNEAIIDMIMSRDYEFNASPGEQYDLIIFNSSYEADPMQDYGELRVRIAPVAPPTPPSPCPTGTSILSKLQERKNFYINFRGYHTFQGTGGYSSSIQCYNTNSSSSPFYRNSLDIGTGQITWNGTVFSYNYSPNQYETYTLTGSVSQDGRTITRATLNHTQNDTRVKATLNTQYTFTNLCYLEQPTYYAFYVTDNLTSNISNVDYNVSNSSGTLRYISTDYNNSTCKASGYLQFYIDSRRP